MVKPSCSNFRVITANVLGVRSLTVLPQKKILLKTRIDITVNFLNIQTPKTFVVITLKFELCGSTIE